MEKYMNRMAFVLAAVGVFVLDRVSKIAVEALLPLHHSVNVIPGLLSLYYTRNKGVAFGLFSGTESWWVPYLLTLISSTALAVILVFSFRHPVRFRRLQWGLMLVLGGAAGNLYDRIRYEYVIDFVEAYYKSYHWPTFNAADASITIGIGLLMLDVLSRKPGIEDRRALVAEDSRSEP
jgi:signal peptidase II